MSKPVHPRAAIEANLLRLASEMGAHIVRFPKEPDPSKPLGEYQRTLTAWCHTRDDMHRTLEILSSQLARTPVPKALYDDHTWDLVCPCCHARGIGAIQNRYTVPAYCLVPVIEFEAEPGGTKACVDYDQAEIGTEVNDDDTLICRKCGVVLADPDGIVVTRD